MNPANQLFSQSIRNRTFSNLIKMGMCAAALATGATAIAQTTLTWTGADATGNLNWSDTNNFSGGSLDATSIVLFDSTTAVTNNAVNNIIDQSYTINSLVYSNFSANAIAGYASFQNTLINPGVTLTVTNGMTVGVSKTPGYTYAPYTYASISGSNAALAVSGADVRVGYQTSGSATLFLFATLDMSGLDTFSHNAPGFVFGVASYPQRRADGEVFLANTNTITALKILASVGVSGSASGEGIIHLGQHNVLNADTQRVGQDAGGYMNFRTNLVNPYLKMRGSDGVSAIGSLYVGSTFSASSGYGFGTNDLSEGTMDAAFVNLAVGLHSGNIAGATRATTGRLIIGASSSNLINVTNLMVGTAPGGGSTTAATLGFGTIDMAGGVFNAVNAVIGSGSYAGTGTGTLNLSGGLFRAGNLTMAQSLSGGFSASTLNLSGGTLEVDGNITNGSGGASTIGITNASFILGGFETNLNNLSISNATLTLAAVGGGAAPVWVTGNFSVDGASTIVVTATNLIAGIQYPVLVYGPNGIQGAAGLNGLTLTLPSGVTGTLVDDPGNQAIDLKVTAVSSPVPVLNSGSFTSAGNFKLIGHGANNQAFQVFGSATVTAPMSSWTLIGSGTANGTGLIQYTDSTATNSSRFYRLR